VTLPDPIECRASEFTTGEDCVWMETALGMTALSRARVAAKLEDYQQRHDEFQRRGDHEAARGIRRLSLNLDLAQPAHWLAGLEGIPVLQPITLKVSKIDWAAVPELGA
jgi:hypothetical protein